MSLNTYCIPKYEQPPTLEVLIYVLKLKGAATEIKDVS